MMQTSLSAKSAVLAQQARLDTIANNIANVNTPGFKSSSVNFKDTLYNALTKPTNTQDSSLQRGTGVAISSINRSFAAGVTTQTSIPLDFCISGDGFFSVQDGQGNKLYTRSGSFAVSVESGGRYLVTPDGYYVTGPDGDKIELPEGDLSQLKCSEAGELTLNGTSCGTLGVFVFPNNDGLLSAGSNCFAQTDASGEAKQKETPVVKQGFLEGSNVDLVTEMTELIRAQKAFAFAAAALKTADEMDATANNMRT